MGGPTGLKACECKACPCQSSGLVCRAAEADPAAFQQLLHRFLFQAHQVVFYEGHESLGLYVLCAGKAKMTRSTQRGSRRIVNILGAGSLIERSGFCKGTTHAATCETLEPSQVCLIEREGYLGLARKNPALAIELLQSVSLDASPEGAAPERAPFSTTTERLAAVLLDLGHRFGEQQADGIRIGVHLTREELAELAGVAPETAIRALSRFRRDRLVATTGREILLLKPDRLGRLAGSL